MTDEQCARLAEAHASRDREWSVMPLKPGSKQPLLATWKRWQAELASHKQIDAWWRQCPDANVGIITGDVSQLYTVDVDDAEGWAALQALLHATGAPALPATASVATGRGIHFYHRYPGPPAPNCAGLWPGLDGRGDGGYVVGATSGHPNGSTYAWRATPEDLPLAPLTATFLAALRRKGDGGWGLGDGDAGSGVRGQGSETNTLPDDVSRFTFHGSRSNPHPLSPNPPHTNPQAYLNKVLDRLAATPVGMRNDRLNRAAYALGRLVGGGQLDRATVEAALDQAAAGLGLPPIERRRTIASGLAAGLRCPRAGDGGWGLGVSSAPPGESGVRNTTSVIERSSLMTIPAENNGHQPPTPNPQPLPFQPPTPNPQPLPFQPPTPIPHPLKHQPPRPTLLDDLLAEPEQDVAWLVAELMTVGGTSLLAGKAKQGKTTLLRVIALAVARGLPFLGYATRPGGVLYLALEDARAGVAAHFRRLGAPERLRLHVVAGRAPDDPLPWLEDLINELQPALVIIDPLFKFLRLPDVNDYATMSRALEGLTDLAMRTRTHILCAHHLNKSEREGTDDVLGSTAISGGLDSILTLRRRAGGRILTGNRRYGGDLDPLPLAFDPATGLVTRAAADATPATAPPARAEADLPERIKATLGEGPLTDDAIRERVGCGVVMLTRVLRAMVADEQLIRTGSGRKNDPYLYALPA